MKPFGILSDSHCHGWSQFAKTDPDGVNSRLRVTLDEFERQAQILQAAGGNRMFHAGDLFHVRGRIDPEVLNPTMDTFRRICSLGIEVIAIAGNHDLAGSQSSKLGNAMQALDEIPGFTAVTGPELFGDMMMIPWIEDLDDLRSVAKSHANAAHDMIIHAPLNGVLIGLPNLGLDPAEIVAWGYRRVFVGHYHAFRELESGAVFSIGAGQHQTWSDPGTLAGFLTVDDQTVSHHESHAPKFVNIDDPAEITRQKVHGNYVRLRMKDADAAALEEAKKNLNDQGALNWVDHSSKKREVTRPNGGGQTNVTLEVSVASYVVRHLECGTLDKRRIAKEALDVLTEARTVGDE